MILNEDLSSSCNVADTRCLSVLNFLQTHGAYTGSGNKTLFIFVFTVCVCVFMPFSALILGWMAGRASGP